MAPSIDKRVVLGLRDSIAALIPTGVLMVCVCTDWCSALAAAFLARLERNLKLRSMIAKKGTDLETDVEKGCTKTTTPVANKFSGNAANEIN